MRTTLTLDDDVVSQLRELAHRRGQSLKDVVNDVIRAGLHAQRAPAGRPYRVTPASLGGVMPGVDLDRALRLADALEDEALARKLEQRK